MLASIGQTIADTGFFHVYCGVQVFGGLVEGYFKRNVTNQDRHFSESIITKVLQVGLAGIYLCQFNIGTALLGLVGVIPFALRLISDDWASSKIEAIITLVARILNVVFQACAIGFLYGAAIGVGAGIIFTAVQLIALKPGTNWGERLEFV